MGKECNLDSTWRWRCSNCYGCSLKTKGNYIDKEPESKNSLKGYNHLNIKSLLNILYLKEHLKISAI